MRDVGFDVLPCHGSYFVNVDIRSVGFNGTDAEFCRQITIEAGVTAVPVSAFYDTDGMRHFARFCFAKQDQALEEAIRRLGTYFKGRRA